ncbi:MAG: hypothetical protein AB8H03_26190 [Saprospiraceae bacterium]
MIRINLSPKDTLTTWIKITKAAGCNLGVDLVMPKNLQKRLCLLIWF